MPREALLVQTLVELADNLVDDFDVLEILTLLTDRCVEVFDVTAAGLMLAAPDGKLRVVASSSEEMRLLEVLELQSQEGPCPDCYRSGEPVLNRNLAAVGRLWPMFGPAAIKAGFQSVHAVPMRLRGLTIGVLNLFRAGEGTLGDADVVAARTGVSTTTSDSGTRRPALMAQKVSLICGKTSERFGVLPRGF